MTTAEIRAWMEARRAAAARETRERAAHRMTPTESLAHAERVRAFIASTGQERPRDPYPDPEQMAVYDIWVRLRRTVRS